jgi:hypothetical protein
MSPTQDHLENEESENALSKKISFKNYKQFKFVDKIKQHYKFSKELIYIFAFASFKSLEIASDSSILFRLFCTLSLFVFMKSKRTSDASSLDLQSFIYVFKMQSFKESIKN